MNLREFLKLSSTTPALTDQNIANKSKSTGLSLSQIKIFSKQLFGALAYMHSFGYVHCDVKPDNILIDASYSEVKLCDFGAVVSENDLKVKQAESYIVARFYRSPEIILDYDSKDNAIDVWAMGITILEMYRADIVFKGKTNNEILWEIMRLFGGLHYKTLKKCRRTEWFLLDNGVEGTVQYLKKQALPEKSSCGNDANSSVDVSNVDGISNDCNTTERLQVIAAAEHASWVDAPRIHSHLREALFQLPSSLLHKVTSKSFDTFVLDTLKIDPSKRISSRDALKSKFLVNE